MRTTSLLLAVLILALPICAQNKPKTETARKPAGSTLRIVKDALVSDGYFYSVKGSIYNPNDEGVKNVVISYRIWKKLAGKDGYGSLIKETGGLVTASIKYLPPKQTVDFTATSHNAPLQIGLTPDPISAEVTAEWDE